MLATIMSDRCSNWCRRVAMVFGNELEPIPSWWCVCSVPIIVMPDKTCPNPAIEMRDTPSALALPKKTLHYVANTHITNDSLSKLSNVKTILLKLSKTFRIPDKLAYEEFSQERM